MSEDEMKTYLTGKKLSAIILVIAAALLFCQSPLFSAERKLIKGKKFNVEKGGLLEVKSDFGDVIVRSWTSDELEIKIFGNEKTEKNVHFSFDKSGNTVTVLAKRPGKFGFNVFNNYSLKFEIWVPKEFKVKISTAGGDVKVIGINGSFDVETSGGDINSENNIGFIKAETSGGDVEIKNHKGNVKIETSGGDIKIQTFGNVNCSTSGGDIDLIVENGSVHAETSGGDVSLKYWGSNKGIFCETSGGDITCVLPDDFKADAKFETLGGSINLDFPNANTRKISHSKFEGSLNGGGEKIKCSTSGGDIEVRTAK
jgi:predicted membrane protein